MRYLMFAVLVIALAGFATSISFAATPVQKTTVENLKAAVTGETTASAKYAAYAGKAREDGLVNVALLFEAASKAEAIHAGNHRAVLEQMGETMGEITPKFEVKSTVENLKDAIKGESYEVASMYPKFIKAANASKSNAALLSFNYAFQTEQKHKALYEKALAAVTDKKVESLPTTYLVCPTCGNTYDVQAPGRCGFCMTSKDRFTTVQ